MGVKRLIDEYNIYDEKEKLLRLARKKHESKQRVYEILWNVPWRKTWGDISSRTTKQINLIKAIEENDEVLYEDWEDAFSCLPEEKYSCCISGCIVGVLTGGLIWHFLKK